MASKILWFFELVIIAVGSWLNFFVKKRMGLFRHFTFRLNQAESSFLANDCHWIWYSFAILGFLIAVLALWQANRRIQFCYRFSWRVHWSIILGICLAVILILAFFSEGKIFIMYPYFLVGLPILALTNLIGCLLIFIFHPNSRACELDSGGSSCQQP